jgi:hypothetical protein
VDAAVHVSAPVDVEVSVADDGKHASFRLKSPEAVNKVLT